MKMDFAIEWPRLDQGGMEELDRWLSEHPDTRLVVIDTLAKIRKKQKANSNLYTEDYEAGEPLKQLSDKHRVAIVVVTHVRKAESKDPLEMVSGTLGLTAGVDGILVLKRQRGEGTASLYVTGRDVPEEKNYGLSWNKDTCRWAIEGDAREVLMSEARKDILEVLAREKRPLSAKEIAVLSRRKFDATRRLLPDMVADALIEQVKDKQRWLYVHPMYASAALAPTPPPHDAAITTPTAPTPPTTHGGVLRRARDGGGATEVTSATAGGDG